jgi:hypothetical protein
MLAKATFADLPRETSWTKFRSAKRKARKEANYYVRPMLTAFSVVGLVVLSSLNDSESYLHEALGTSGVASRMLLESSKDAESSGCSEICGSHTPLHPPLFDEATMNAGGVCVHILIMLYMFAGMAAVCDDYLEDALEKICDVSRSLFPIS